MGAQSVNQATYVLTVTDLVNKPMNFTYSEIVNDFQSVKEVVPIICVEGWSATVLWQGVPISDLLNQTGVSPQANTLIFYGADGYTSSLPLSVIEQYNMILAYKINNVTLTAQTGFPFILVAQNQYGYKWVKWVTEIDVSSNSSYLGYWESRGYPNNATIDKPTHVAPTNLIAIVEILVVSAVIITMAVATYLIVVRIRNRYSETSRQT